MRIKSIIKILKLSLLFNNASNTLKHILTTVHKISSHSFDSYSELS